MVPAHSSFFFLGKANYFMNPLLLEYFLLSFVYFAEQIVMCKVDKKESFKYCSKQGTLFFFSSLIPYNCCFEDKKLVFHNIFNHFKD